ncbi:MAG TPA: transposase [Verrucomicrobiae bacterium]|jgi:hypothetical protein
MNRPYTAVIKKDGGWRIGWDGGNPRRQWALSRPLDKAHARRRFWQAHELDREDGDLLAVLGTIGELYAIEEQARQQNLDAGARLELRRQKSVGLMEQLKRKIVEIRQQVLPRSTAGDACNYALNQWNRLRLFLEDGQIEIDNNICENGIRPVALGTEKLDAYWKQNCRT